MLLAAAAVWPMPASADPADASGTPVHGRVTARLWSQAGESGPENRDLFEPNFRVRQLGLEQTSSLSPTG